jgi:uncharacterized membrane protein YccC
MFHILDPNEFSEVARQRIADTIAGSIIAFLASILLPPIWEREQITELMEVLTRQIAAYFESVAFVFTGGGYDRLLASEKRKQAWVALANVSDAFTRMLSEPKSTRKDSKELHRFVVSSHMLVSHLATLSYYADSLQPAFVTKDYLPLIRASVVELKDAGNRLKNPYFEAPAKNSSNPQLLLDERLTNLIKARQRELQAGQLETDNKKFLSTFKSITDQFNFIYKTSQDLCKISKSIQPV